MQKIQSKLTKYAFYYVFVSSYWWLIFSFIFVWCSDFWLNMQFRAVDLLHRAAYRRGLGNSLFVSPKKISSISSESLQHFASTTLSHSRCAIVVIGNNQVNCGVLYILYHTFNKIQYRVLLPLADKFIQLFPSADYIIIFFFSKFYCIDIQ